MGVKDAERIEPEYRCVPCCCVAVNAGQPASKDIFNPIALRKAKIVCNFGLSECNRVKILPS